MESWCRSTSWSSHIAGLPIWGTSFHIARFASVRGRQCHLIWIRQWRPLSFSRAEMASPSLAREKEFAWHLTLVREKRVRILGLALDQRTLPFTCWDSWGYEFLCLELGRLASTQFEASSFVLERLAFLRSQSTDENDRNTSPVFGHCNLTIQLWKTSASIASLALVETLTPAPPAKFWPSRAWSGGAVNPCGARHQRGGILRISGQIASFSKTRVSL